ncbi:Wadjet anti-phage system protein JetD domain-containing protein [Corynebacterium comes]|uniref:Wadjet anti-phage system protein JetD domain-containing protein n=1 Tax=Corynebacterium comes TaxID=2675218 RepID=UPI0018CF9C98|nr:Wadjet anti-phage system protein JetD domain-containing protein [Corynebacterium comes]
MKRSDVLSLIEARARALRFLRSRERELLAGDFEGYGFPLRPPTAAQAAADEPAVKEFTRQWQEVAGVEVAVRNWSSVGLGRQNIPVRLHLDTVDALVDFTGHRSEWEDLVQRRDLLASVVGSLAPVVAALPLWKGVPEMDLHLAGEVVDWFEAHPASGVPPRAVAVEGVHTKWLERHRPLVETLLAGRRGEMGRAELGLAAPTPRVRLRFHLSDAPAGLADVEIPVVDLASLPVPRAVVMVENLESFLALPTRPGVVLAWGGGYRAADIVRAPYFADSPLIYWGDLDADGYGILDAVRSAVPSVRSVLMDRDTVTRWQRFGVADRDFQGRLYFHLTDSELAGLDALIEAGHLRIEQERIRFDVAVAAVDDALTRL